MNSNIYQEILKVINPKIDMDKHVLILMSAIFLLNRNLRINPNDKKVIGTSPKKNMRPVFMLVRIGRRSTRVSVMNIATRE